MGFWYFWNLSATDYRISIPAHWAPKQDKFYLYVQKPFPAYAEIRS
jgi:hypothetical protein